MMSYVCSQIRQRKCGQPNLVGTAVTETGMDTQIFTKPRKNATAGTSAHRNPDARVSSFFAVTTEGNWLVD